VREPLLGRSAANGANSQPLRAWQAEALPLALASLRDPGRAGLIRAVMGAGKSVLLREIVRALAAELPPGEQILVSAPKIRLVRQLADTLSGADVGRIGRVYTDEQTLGGRVTVVCHDSLERYAELLGERRVYAWLADEAHQTETPTVHAAIGRLAPARRLGVTATPWRADTSESLTLWGEVIYDYGPARAVADGVLVDWDVRTWEGDEVTALQAGIAMSAELDGPGLWNARTIAEAEEVADAIRAARGGVVHAVHSGLLEAAQDRRIAEVVRERGVLVHVSMLSEGVDIPELRWLVCYRPVASRVRFAQEIGRVLRTAPGKDVAVILDPLDQVRRHRLTHEAAVGGIREDEDQRPQRKLAQTLLDLLEAEPLETLFARPARRGQVTSILAQLAYEAAERSTRPLRTVAPGAWQQCDITDRQAALLRGADIAAWESSEDPVHHLLVELASAPEALRRGPASDLITCLMADHRR
jgi:superfamily II DNA or RNA helicase